MVEGTPPGDALPPPPQRATPARKGARCGAGAVSPRPHRPHPGHTKRGTLAARSRGRPAGRGTAPDTRRPSQRWKAPPPGTPFRRAPQRATPARKGARCGAGAGSPRPHRPHPGHKGRGTLAARSRGRAASRGTAPDTRRPSQWWKAPPPGDALPPPPQRATPARKGARCGAGAGSPRPHRPHPGHTGRGTQAARSRGRAAGGGTAPDTRRPSQRWKAPPPGTPFRQPRREQRQPARAHAVGLMLGPHARIHRTQDTRVAEPRLPAPEDGRPGEGQRLTPGAPHNSGRPPPPGTAPHHPRGTQPPQGMQAKETVLGPHTHTPAPTARGWQTPTARRMGRPSGEGQRLTPDAPHNGGGHPPRERPSATPTASNASPQGRTLWGRCWVSRPHRPHPGHTGSGTLAARSRGRAAGGGTAPDTRRPSQRWKAPPPGTPFRHPRSEQRQPARAHAVGPVLGPHARIDRIRDTRDAEPRLPAPEDGRPGEGQRLTPGAPHNGGRPPPPGTAPHHPRGMQPSQGMQAKETVLGPHTHTPAPTARGWRTPTARPEGGQSGEGQRLTSDAPHNGGRHSPGDALPPPPQRATPARKGARCGAGAGSPRPQRPHPGHTGRGTQAARSRGRAAGGGTAPDTRRPSQRWQATPPRDGPPATPAARSPHRACRPRRQCWAPTAHTPAPTARGWRTPTARPMGRQSGEGQRLTPDAPHNGRRHPPRGYPSATPTASNAGPQGRTL